MTHVSKSKNQFLLIVVFLTFTSFLNTVSAQQEQSALGTWNILNIRYEIDEKWSLFGEAQIRSLRFYDHFHYYEMKGGVNYKLKKEVQLSLGAGDYDTYLEGGNFVNPKNNDEFRIWPMLTVNQSLGRLKIEHRYRAEMRFTLNGYRNRFRYRLNVQYPVSISKKLYKKLIFNVSNELFFTNNEPYFERNRLQFGVMHKFNSTFSLFAGYLHQFDYKINDETGRDFLQIGTYFEF